jgi:Zn-dependent protease with chaperone function
MQIFSPHTFFTDKDINLRSSLIFALIFVLAIIFTFFFIFIAFRFCYLLRMISFRTLALNSDHILNFFKALFSFQRDESFIVSFIPTITFFIIALGCSIQRILMIKNGGSSYVATTLGGIPLGEEAIFSNSEWIQKEKILNNVIAEISLASGLSPPDLYVMPYERGINAFAAGLTRDDAAVIFTAGSLKHLTRDELTGLVAHEFSHILNGDMRANTIMSGWLHGLFTIANLGWKCIAPESKKNQHPMDNSHSISPFPLVLLGIFIIFLGSVGAMTGMALQAAFSRRRELLADAFAVQFTRNSLNLAGVLKKIGGLSQGSKIRAGANLEYRHFFLARPDKYYPFDSHPDLAERIWHLDPSWDGNFYDFSKDQQTDLGNNDKYLFGVLLK